MKVPRRIGPATKPQLSQPFVCPGCSGTARTTRFEYKQYVTYHSTWTERIHCLQCRMEMVIETPVASWPEGGLVQEYTSSDGRARSTTRLSRPLVGPPVILCSRCGEVLEKADDCFRCSCGREVRP